MPFDDIEHREAQVATLQRTGNPETPSRIEPPNDASDSAHDQYTAYSTAGEGDSDRHVDLTTHPLRLTLTLRTRALGAGASLFMLLAFLLVVADAGGRPSGRKSAIGPRPTATATLTPSPTVFPTPTPLPGFQVYLPQDYSEGFLIQYPSTWTASSNYPGVEFDDDKVNPTHEVQVLLPGDATAVGVSGDPQDASVWVSYELNKLADKWGSSFSQISGPSPAVQINDVTWQSGQAILSESQTHIRVQVYATVHNNKVYIINLLAGDDTYWDSVSRYFTPMLHSFMFLPERTN